LNRGKGEGRGQGLKKGGRRGCVSLSSFSCEERRENLFKAGGGKKEGLQRREGFLYIPLFREEGGKKGENLPKKATKEIGDSLAEGGKSNSSLLSSAEGGVQEGLYTLSGGRGGFFSFLLRMGKRVGRERSKKGGGGGFSPLIFSSMRGGRGGNRYQSTAFLRTEKKEGGKWGLEGRKKHFFFFCR